MRIAIGEVRVGNQLLLVRGAVGAHEVEVIGSAPAVQRPFAGEGSRERAAIWQQLLVGARARVDEARLCGNPDAIRAAEQAHAELLAEAEGWL